MPLDRRTYIIIVLMLVICLPIIIFIFRESFLPMMSSLKELFMSADLYQSAGTGVPQRVLENIK